MGRLEFCRRRRMMSSDRDCPTRLAVPPGPCAIPPDPSKGTVPTNTGPRKKNRLRSEVRLPGTIDVLEGFAPSPFACSSGGAIAGQYVVARSIKLPGSWGEDKLFGGGDKPFACRHSRFRAASRGKGAPCQLAAQ